MSREKVAVGKRVRRPGDPVGGSRTQARAARWSDGLAELALGLIGLALWSGARSVYEREPALALGLAALVVALLVVGVWSFVRQRTPVARWERPARVVTLVALVVVASLITALSLALV